MADPQNSNELGGTELLDGDDPIDNQGNVLAQLDMAFVVSSKAIYDHVTSAFPLAVGKAASKKEREDLVLKATTLVYGEISFEAFGVVIEKIKKIYGKPDVGSSGEKGVLQNRGGLFYDLGHGTGKAVVAAAILHNFDQCIGFEILEGLFSISLDMQAAYNTRGKSKLTDREFDTFCTFLHADFLDVKAKDWRDGDVVFANSTCYDDELMNRIAMLALGMKRGSFFVTFTKRLPTNDFTVVEHTMERMSWGEATVYIHQKNTEPRQPVPV
jgi:SAM-dependent methyltransferase